LPEPSPALLSVTDLVTGYGKKQVVTGVSLTVGAGEVVAIIGHNGAGKSTLLRAIFGMLPVWSGEIRLDACVLRGVKPRALLQAGVAYVPQGSHVFSEMTVRENLELGGVTLATKRDIEAAIERVITVFPGLGGLLKRSAGTLSGGEKQVLALARGLVTSPRLLLLDEPSLGLAAGMVSQALEHIQELNRRDGVSVLIVEQKVREVLRIAHEVVVLANGRVSFAGAARELHDDAKLHEVYL